MSTSPTLTCGEIAILLGVCARTVSKWCDSGKLKCHRLPGSSSRRILRSDLDFFLRVNGLPSVAEHQASAGVT